jgi:hypothetical protein
MAIFDKIWGCVAIDHQKWSPPEIQERNDQRLIHLTPHMFPCHISHSQISGGDHFLVKNPYGLAFCIIENGR